MLVLDKTKTVLEGELKLSDCERPFIVRWLSGSSQASLFIGDTEEEKDGIQEFIIGKHECFIDLDSYLKYLKQISIIANKYKAMYHGPLDYLDRLLRKFSSLSPSQAKVILFYERDFIEHKKDRYIRILNNKSNRAVNEPIFGTLSLENGDDLRYSFVGGITNIRIEKINNSYKLSINLVSNWRDILMSASGKKVTLDKIIDIFNSEMAINIDGGRAEDESAQIFGIKFAPLLQANRSKFTVVDIVSGSNYNNEGIVDAVNKGVELSPAVIWTKNLLEEDVSDGGDYQDILSHNLFGIHIKNENDALSEENPHICIGWSALGNLSGITSREDLSNLYENVWPDKKKMAKAQDVGQIWRFISEAQIDDYVIFAEPKRIHIGKIVSDYFYDDTVREGQDADYTNNRTVEWIRTNIDRSLLSLAFHHSLGSAMSFFSINDYRAAIVDLLNDRYEKDESVEEVEDDYVEDLTNYDEAERLRIGANIILYGVPGAGKSWTIKNEYCDSDTVLERVVFHPDYTYSDFVGQIMPKAKNGDVSYEFNPGPFTKIVKEAYRNPLVKHVLVVEEINRGNAPAIFGDIFQLLDRNPQTKESDYEITNADIAKVVYGDENHKVRIPSNLLLICTMNTSDQNVFTLDTAFQRRWDMRLVENSFKKETQEEKDFAEHRILDTNITWEQFVIAINREILEKNKNMTSSEDKRLGTHFVNVDDLEFNEDEFNEELDSQIRKQASLHNRKFPEKVIKYLWDDAFKFYRDEIFRENLDSLEKVIRFFIENKGNDRFNIFKENIKNSIERPTINNNDWFF